MIRIAAIGDVHVGLDDVGSLAPALADLHEHADMLLIAGDLTRHGDPAEARILGAELAAVQVPTFVVLGNHDHHLDLGDEITTELEAVGVQVLEQATATLEISGRRVAIVGAKGFGGGFEGACGSEFGEPQMKAFVRHTREVADTLEQLVALADADHVVVLLHYAPTVETVEGERREIYPFLGSYLLGNAIDSGRVDLVLHGHAHHGTERGCTTGGTPVRNVARPLVGVAYRRFELGSQAARDHAHGAPRLNTHL
ncbi:MAG: metallophosphoesterase [Thermoleophilia bacterium]|jgi:Icc-related predicted phosphoesterase|nr:metallophosphoesterase [Thermoleophilia bacterium]